jgi:hypothetical protein
MKAFISYCHQDARYKDEMHKWLIQLKRDNLIELWDDQEIFPGQSWDNAIKSKLDEADVVFFLVTPNFIASDYINRIEISRTVESAKSNEKLAIPILCQVSSFEDSLLAQFQASPKGKPIETWANVNEAWKVIYDDIKKVIATWNDKRKQEQAFSVATSGAPKYIIKSNVPPKNYTRFVGREKYISQIFSCFDSSDCPGLITIDAMGGMGKTSLARQIVAQCEERGLFRAYIWMSAARQRFAGGSIHEIENPDFTIDRVISEIATLTGNRPIINIGARSAQQQAIINILKETRALIVLDNMETVPNLDGFIENVLMFTYPAKLIVTARVVITNDNSFRVFLEPFSEQEGINFLKMTGQIRNIMPISSVNDQDLSEIVRRIGGAPLLLQLVVGQWQFKEVRQIISELGDLSNTSTESVFRFLYLASWKMLSQNCQDVLVSLAPLLPMVGAKLQDIVDVNDELSPSVVRGAIQHLIKMSLVIPIIGMTTRYALHPLTQTAILQGIGGILPRQHNDE